MVRLASKLKIIEGAQIPVQTARKKELKRLQTELEANGLTGRNIVVYAHHFVRLGSPLLAQKYLNKLDRSYFKIGVYRDLFHALLNWSMIQVNPTLYDKLDPAVYQYFIIVKQATEAFDSLTFECKPEFEDFKTVLREFSKVQS